MDLIIGFILKKPPLFLQGLSLTIGDHSIPYLKGLKRLINQIQTYSTFEFFFDSCRLER